MRSKAPVSDADLRKFRTDDLVRSAGDFVDLEEEWESFSPQERAASKETHVITWAPSRRMPLLLGALGILPVCGGGRHSRMYMLAHQVCVFMLAVFSLIACLEQTSATRVGDFAGLAGSMCYGPACLRLGLLSDLSLATGSVIGFGVVVFWGKGMVDCVRVLVMYTERIEYTDIWEKKVRRDLIATLVVWLAAVFERARGSLMLDHISFVPGLLHIAAFAITSSVLMGLAFVVLYISSALTTIVDAFCISYHEHQDLDQTVQDWNAIQAVIRKASYAVEFCFFVLQSTALVTVLLMALDGINPNSQVDLLIPAVLLTAGIGRIFFRAGALTDKCVNVPSLINSFGEGIDIELQYVVQYLIHSDAGFHVFDVRLTSPMAFKFVYLCGAAAFVIATRYS
jgi:hypothetical protein